MRRRDATSVRAAGVWAAVVLAWTAAAGPLESRAGEPPPATLAITYPRDGTVFPPQIVAPMFRWTDDGSGADEWLITVDFGDGATRARFSASAAEWRPEAGAWDTITKRSVEAPATVTVTGVRRAAPGEALSRGRVSIRTSKDEVGAPIFYREVNLPFRDAVRDPSRIRWRFGPVSSPNRPPVVLENLPLCGNCHSFPSDGRTLAMDVDYANSKGSYVIAPVAEQMVLAPSDIISWDNYRPEDGDETFGLLSQISPDGRRVVSTVKDRSVFVPMPDLAFSQLFFPIKGILVVYDRETRVFRSLPGADDPAFVQSNPAWSPDGKTLVFARAKAHDMKHVKGKVLLTPEECKEFVEEGKLFRYDLYRIPYNDGRGGKAEPLEGASGNGLSNYFAKYSPDGKWIVFCRANSYMLLQPDSELYILPASGGKARRLRCNTGRMNSWHSWSPNGRWLVFASKANGPYTQLFLAHIDEEGESAPPVLLEHFTDPDRAANIPEFVNVGGTAIRQIDERFMDDRYYVRVGDQFLRSGSDEDLAIREYRKALALNPDNAEAHQKLGLLLYNVKAEYDEGMAHYRRALQSDPNYAPTYFDLGMALLHRRQLDQAIPYLAEAVRRMPEGHGTQYDPAQMRYQLANALLMKGGNVREAEAHLREAARRAPANAQVQYALAAALATLGQTDEALGHYAKAVQIDPKVDRSAALHERFAMNYAQAGRFPEAVLAAEKALRLARAAGRAEFARRIEQRLRLYRQGQAAPPTPPTP